MAYGIRISKDGIDATKALTSTNIKDFVFLSDKDSPKVYYANSIDSGGVFDPIVYVHNLGYVPMHFLFLTDSIVNPTYYSLALNTASSTTTITQFPGQYGYLMILKEGN